MYNKNALTVYVNSCLINSLSTGFANYITYLVTLCYKLKLFRFLSSNKVIVWTVFRMLWHNL